jgi:HD-like signal output (HDOD) protein
MSETNGFVELKKKFSVADHLPELPDAALKLIHTLEGADVNMAEVERIITADPALTAAIIRAASAAIFGGVESIATVRGAIARLGLSAVQAVGVSLGVQALIGRSGASPLFDHTRFARHSVFVGFMARYLFASRHNHRPFNSKWVRDEIFAAGILHETGLGLLASLDTDSYGYVFNRAKRENSTLTRAFEKTYGASIHRLAAIAAQTWRLPQMFTDVLTHLDDPLSAESEEIALSCLSYADFLANEHHYGLTQWPSSDPVPEGILEEAGLPEEELPGVVMLVSRHTTAYVPLARAA